MSFSIVLKSPDTVTDGERCSKLLDPDSPLYRLIVNIRTRIKSKYEVCEKRGIHIELLHPTRNKNPPHVLQRRAGSVHGRTVNMKNTDFIGQRAFALLVGDVPGYGQAHITIAFLPNGHNGLLHELREITRDEHLKLTAF